MFILENSKLFFGFSWKYVVSKIGKGGTHLYCVRTHPDTWFWKGGPHGNILSGTNVGIPISGKQCFQFLKLLRGKMSALPPLTFIIHVVFVVVIVVVFTIIWICWRFDLIFGLIELTVGVIRTLTGFKGSWIWNRKMKDCYLHTYYLDLHVCLKWDMGSWVRVQLERKFVKILRSSE